MMTKPSSTNASCKKPPADAMSIFGKRAWKIFSESGDVCASVAFKDPAAAPKPMPKIRIPAPQVRASWRRSPERPARRPAQTEGDRREPEPRDGRGLSEVPAREQLHAPREEDRGIVN